MTTAPIESVFSRAWQLLTRNWVLIVPGIIIGLIVGVVSALPAYYAQSVVSADGTYQVGNALGAMTTGLVAGLVGLLGFVATQAYTVGMAGAAWTRGTTTLDDGAAAFRDSAGNIIITAIGLVILGFIAVFCSIFTLGLAFLAFILFTLYAMPAAIIGKQPGFSSITESFQIATKRFVPTLIIAVLIGVITLVAGIITLPLHFIPFLGPIIGAIITQIIVVYAVLVIVGEYLTLRGTLATAATATSFGTPPAYGGGGAAPFTSASPQAPSDVYGNPAPPAEPYTPPSDPYIPPPGGTNV